MLRLSLLAGSTAAVSGCLDGGDTDEAAAYERAIHEHVNAVRADNNRDPYAYHEEIAAIARAHSDDMVEREYFGHESPDGEDSGDRLAEFFPGYCMGIAENIVHVAGDLDTDPDTVAQRALSQWLESAGHRRNILSEEFDEHGVGVAFADGRVVITQKFCASGD